MVEEDAAAVHALLDVQSVAVERAHLPAALGALHHGGRLQGRNITERRTRPPPPSARTLRRTRLPPRRGPAPPPRPESPRRRQRRPRPLQDTDRTCQPRRVDGPGPRHRGSHSSHGRGRPGTACTQRAAGPAALPRAGTAPPRGVPDRRGCRTATRRPGGPRARPAREAGAQGVPSPYLRCACGPAAPLPGGSGTLVAPLPVRTAGTPPTPGPAPRPPRTTTPGAPAPGRRSGAARLDSRAGQPARAQPPLDRIRFGPYRQHRRGRALPNSAEEIAEGPRHVMTCSRCRDT